MGESVRIGRVAGIEVGFNWSLLVVFWLIAWSLAAGSFPEQVPGYSSGAYWSAALLTALLFFGSLLLHELAHALVARRSGVEVEGITLWLFGGVARLRGEAMNAGVELRISAAGPATSIGVGGILLALSIPLDAVGAHPLVVGGARWLGVINIILAVFNLLPGFPLDGGRVLRALLWNKRGDRVSATRTAARAGRILAYVLIGLGIAEFALAASLGGLWFVFLGWFLLGAAQAEESQTLLRAALRDVRVQDVMSRDPVTVPEDTSVRQFIDSYALRHKFSTFPVVARSGQPVGLVTLSRVKQLPPEGRGRRRVHDVACALDEVATVAPEDLLVNVLERTEQCSEGRALVLDDGRLVGIVSPRDIQRAIVGAGLRGQAPRELAEAWPAA
ncbi:MAG: site-2 protease family protein [Actinomycetota bacterium]|nr:site-2 protease family protein [Actinomycetota bacterium]